MSRVQVAVFDQAPLFRAGIAQAVNADAGMQMVAEGGSLAEANSVCAQHSVDVLIIDATLAEGEADFPSAIQRLSSIAKVILLALAVDEQSVRSAFAAGVRGYVTRRAVQRELLEAVCAVHRGEGYISPALAAMMMRNPSPEPSAGVSPTSRALTHLTYREGQIFKLLAAGLKNKEIGARLSLSEKSIKRYVTVIFEKLNVRNRVEAALLSGREEKTNPQVPAAHGALEAYSDALHELPDAAEHAVASQTAIALASVFGSLPPLEAVSERPKSGLGTHVLLRS